MVVAIKSDGSMYQLKGGINNSNWTPFSADSANIQSHLTDYNNPHRTDKNQIGLNNVDNVKQIPYTEKGVAGGVASLDPNGKIPTGQIPAIALTDVYAVDTIAERDNLATNGSVQTGDVVIVGESGRTFFYLGGSNWAVITAGGDVISVRQRR